jgi:hypothetical protein
MLTLNAAVKVLISLFVGIRIEKEGTPSTLGRAEIVLTSRAKEH